MNLESKIMDGQMYVSDEMLSLLESEISRVVKTFLTLSSPVKVRFKKEGNELIFMTSFSSNRVRSLGFVPRQFL